MTWEACQATWLEQMDVALSSGRQPGLPSHPQQQFVKTCKSPAIVLNHATAALGGKLPPSIKQ